MMDMRKLARFFYTFLLYILVPFLLPIFFFAQRSGKNKEKWELLSRQRLGKYKRAERNIFGTNFPIWIHAASLGETKAIAPLVKILLRRGYSILLTNTTPSGKKEGCTLFVNAIKHGKLSQAWLPYDFPKCTRNFLENYKPWFGVLVEREIWPNLLAEAEAKKIPMFLVNARLSEKSLRKISCFSSVFKASFNSLSITFAQTVEDANRLKEAGAVYSLVTGNVKFDSVISDLETIKKSNCWKKHINKRIIVLASVREGENILFLKAIKLLHLEIDERFLFLIVPRHSASFKSTFLLLKNLNLRFECRSNLGEKSPSRETSIVLGDSIGEMSFYYKLADIAIMGGGFLPFGGHNLIEACGSGVPTILGPYNFNFQEASESAIRYGAALQAKDSVDALEKAISLLQNDSKYSLMQSAAFEWVAKHKGATYKTLDLIMKYVKGTYYES